jgi:hypothetical protein
MKIIGTCLFVCLTTVVWAQLSPVPVPAANAKPAFNPGMYDNFNSTWFDPAKWVVIAPSCARTLECVREIQHGKLRLALRNVGYSDTDSGDQFSYDELYFTNPGAIRSIKADVTVMSFSGAQCATNPGGWTHASVEVGGSYFNTGTNDANGDVSDIIALVVDPNDAKTVNVSNWLSGSNLGVSTEIGSYALGTPLIATITWDQTNHRFLSSVKVKGETGSGTQVVVPYSVSDVTPAVQALRFLDAAVDTANCTSAPPIARVEALYDNVVVK